MVLTAQRVNFVRMLWWKYAPAIGISALVFAIFSALYFPLTAYGDGNYAGFHFGDGQGVVQRAMIVNYGSKFTATLTYATPPRGQHALQQRPAGNWADPRLPLDRPAWCEMVCLHLGCRV